VMDGLINEYGYIMFLITLGVYLTVGWIVGLILVKRLVDKHKVEQLRQLSNGRGPRPHWIFEDAGGVLMVGGSVGTAAAHGLALIWPISIPFLTIVGFLIGVLYLIDWYNQEEKVVLRLLQCNPDVLETILKEEGHTYYSIAKKLETSGVIKFNGDTVEIDGKLYELKMK